MIAIIKSYKIGETIRYVDIITEDFAQYAAKYAAWHEVRISDVMLQIQPLKFEIVYTIDHLAYYANPQNDKSITISVISNDLTFAEIRFTFHEQGHIKEMIAFHKSYKYFYIYADLFEAIKSAVTQNDILQILQKLGYKNDTDYDVQT